jgi:hypothetical protein
MWSGSIETKVKEVPISIFLFYPKGFAAGLKSLSNLWKLLLE